MTLEQHCYARSLYDGLGFALVEDAAGNGRCFPAANCSLLVSSVSPRTPALTCAWPLGFRCDPESFISLLIFAHALLCRSYMKSDDQPSCAACFDWLLDLMF